MALCKHSAIDSGRAGCQGHLSTLYLQKNKSDPIDITKLSWTELAQHTSYVCEFTGRLKGREAIHPHADACLMSVQTAHLWF